MSLTSLVLTGAAALPYEWALVKVLSKLEFPVDFSETTAIETAAACGSRAHRNG
jgi:hypothetical protein